MEFHPLPPLDVLRVQGQARAVVNPGPRTIQQVLDDARHAMEIDEALEDWMAGRPVKQLRHPRRTLRQWLTGRQPEPAPVPAPVTEIVPVWRAVDPGGT
jgi:hypothetical protein